MLQFQNILHEFPDGTRAIQDVSLTIPKGQFCVLLGPSGAGKSTLLNTVNGLVTPTVGQVCLDSLPINRKNLKIVRSRIGMIHQQLHLVPRLTVLDNVLSGLLPITPNWRALLKHFLPSQQRKACRLLEEVELEEKQLYRRASDLSGGQQQRVAIARAFVNNPDVVLADEPVASLDPAVSRQVLELLQRSSRMRNTTVLCSLHQVEFAIEFADRLIAMRNGSVVYDGTPDGLSKEVLEAVYGPDLGDMYDGRSEQPVQPVMPSHDKAEVEARLAS